MRRRWLKEAMQIADFVRTADGVASATIEIELLDSSFQVSCSPS